MDCEMDIMEALRYLGAGRNPPPELREQVSQAARKLTSALRPRWTWKMFRLTREKGKSAFCLYESASEPDCPALCLAGQSAETMLSSCQQAILLACTLGVEFDAMLRAAQARDMSDAVILDACASAWVEAGCGAAEREIAERFPKLYLTDRFSPGYGDLPLSLQRDICAILDTPRRLGVHVTDSLLMNPAKSVTAVIGIADRPQMARIRGCGYCAMRETCPLRKGGQRCAF